MVFNARIAERLAIVEKVVLLCAILWLYALAKFCQICCCAEKKKKKTWSTSTVEECYDIPVNMVDDQGGEVFV